MIENKKIRPNFFIVGAPKCGTTSWVRYLSDHPDICFSSKKEPHYFNTDFESFRWARTELEYLELFEFGRDRSVVGEASVQYLYSSEAAVNISKFNPDARILIMLRNPGEFIRSYHNQLLLNLDEDVENLREAWEMSGLRRPEGLPVRNRESAFLDYKRVGLFSEQVSRYLDYFDRSQVMVVFMDDWKSCPRDLYVELMRFLCLEDDGRTDFTRLHAAKHVSSRILHQMTQRPPSKLRALSRLVKKIPVASRINFVDLIRAANIRQGYNDLNEDIDLLLEIESYFSEDQSRLYRLL